MTDSWPVCDLFLRRLSLRTAARNEDLNSPVVTVNHMLTTPPTLGRKWWVAKSEEFPPATPLTPQ